MLDLTSTLRRSGGHSRNFVSLKAFRGSSGVATILSDHRRCCMCDILAVGHFNGIYGVKLHQGQDSSLRAVNVFIRTGVWRTTRKG
jgi:hypothetical protein